MPKTREITTVCIKTGPWSELILSLGFFTVYVLSSFHSSWQPGKQTNKLSGQIKQVFSLRVPALVNMAVLHRIWGVFFKKERKKKSLMYEFCLVYIQGEQFHPCLFQPASPIPSGSPSLIIIPCVVLPEVPAIRSLENESIVHYGAVYRVAFVMGV